MYKLSDIYKEDRDSTDEEYYETVEQYHDQNIIDQIRMGDNMAKRMTGGKIITKRSDNLIIRWVEGNYMLMILGLVSKQGSIKISDLPDFNKWINMLIKKMRDGYAVYTSTNELSKPILDKILSKIGKENLSINVSPALSDPASGMTWENIIIKMV